MIHPRVGWLILAAAAALPLAGAEPDLDMRTKTRDLYMKYTQAPAGQDSPALKAAAEELLDLTPRRPESRPAAPTTAPASRPAPTDPGAPAAPASQPARHELDPAAVKALASATGADVALLIATADGLFLGGRLTDAAALYEIAANGPGEAETLAWATYQLGNCRRKLAPVAAAQLYDKVRQEPADCPWRDAAEASLRLLEWMKTENLSALLEPQKPVEDEAKEPAVPAIGLVKD